MRTVQAFGKIQIGKQGENKAVAVIFDVAEWIALYGTGSFTLAHRRHTDNTAYPCAISYNNGVVTWVITNADNAVEGLGECELRLTVNGTIAKSKTWITETIKSLTVGATPPEPWQAWIDEVFEAADEAEASATEAAGYATEAMAQKQIAGAYADDAEGYADDAESYKNEAAAIMGQASFEIVVSDGNLYITYPTPYSGATFAISAAGYLEVTA